MLSYLDAATGSMIVSAIAGGAAGLSVAGKMGVKRLKGKLNRGADETLSADESALEEPPATVDAATS
ncbi:MAG: hypothetical protein ACN4GZ_05350 [Acidimicrobiales bacterium]